MTPRLFALMLAAGILVLGMPRFGSAAPQALGDNERNWDGLGRLTSGVRIRVVTDQDRDIKGTLRSADTDVLALVDSHGIDRTIPREQVRQVQVGPKHGAGRYAGFGLLLGAALGTVVGSANRGESELSGLAPVFGLTFGAFIGGPVGYAVGSGISGRPWRVVYERPTGASSTAIVSPVISGKQKGVRLTIGF